MTYYKKYLKYKEKYLLSNNNKYLSGGSAEFLSSAEIISSASIVLVEFEETIKQLKQSLTINPDIIKLSVLLTDKHPIQKKILDDFFKQLDKDILVLQEEKDTVFTIYKEIINKLNNYIQKYNMFIQTLRELYNINYEDYKKVPGYSNIWSGSPEKTEGSKDIIKQELEMETIVGDKKYVTKQKFMSDMKKLLQDISMPTTNITKIVETIKSFKQNKNDYDSYLESQQISGPFNFKHTAISENISTISEKISENITKLKSLLEKLKNPKQIFTNYNDCELLFNVTPGFKLFYENFLSILKNISESLKDMGEQVLSIKVQCDATKSKIQSLLDNIIFDDDAVRSGFSNLCRYTIQQIDVFLENINPKFASSIESVTKSLYMYSALELEKHIKKYKMITNSDVHLPDTIDSILHLPDTFDSSLQCYEYFLLSNLKSDLGILHSTKPKVSNENGRETIESKTLIFIINGQLTTIVESSSEPNVFIKFNKDYLQKYFERINLNYLPIDGEKLLSLNDKSADELTNLLKDKDILFCDIDGNNLIFIDISIDKASDSIKPIIKVTFNNEQGEQKVFHINEIFISMTGFKKLESADEDDLYA